jgi:hypothetical protein
MSSITFCGEFIIKKSGREIIAELQSRREKARLGGGQARIDKQHSLGKLTARELMFCWMKVRLKKLICLLFIVSETSVWMGRLYLAMVLLQVQVR